MIKVSVIVPVYNKEKYIVRCLESLINQTLNEIEIICIDDCSSDESYSILREYQKKDKRIRLFHMNENKGAAFAKNYGLEMSRGEYVQFVDADDYVDLQMLEELYSKMKEAVSDLCFLKMQVQLEDINIDAVNNGILKSYNGIYNGKELMSLFLDNNEFFLYASLVMFSKAFLDRNRLRYKEVRIGEGGNMNIRALYIADRVIVADKRYYHYCVNAQSVTNMSNRRIQTLLGQIYQYVDMMRIIAVEKNSSVLERFIEKYQKKISGGIKNLQKESIEYVKDNLEDGFAKQIFNTFLNESKYVGDFSDIELRKIVKATEIIIFGAGYAAGEVLELLNKYGVSIVGFAVTNKEKNPVSLYGHKVFSIDELLSYNNCALVLVAVNKKYHEQIEGTLRDKGFNNYLLLNISM